MKQINHIYQNKYYLYIQNKISPELLECGLQREQRDERVRKVRVYYKGLEYMK